MQTTRAHCRCCTVCGKRGEKTGARKLKSLTQICVVDYVAFFATPRFPIVVGCPVCNGCRRQLEQQNAPLTVLVESTIAPPAATIPFSPISQRSDVSHFDVSQDANVVTLDFANDLDNAVDALDVSMMKLFIGSTDREIEDWLFANSDAAGTMLNETKEPERSVLLRSYVDVAVAVTNFERAEREIEVAATKVASIVSAKKSFMDAIDKEANALVAWQKLAIHDNSRVFEPETIVEFEMWYKANCPILVVCLLYYYIVTCQFVKHSTQNRNSSRKCLTSSERGTKAIATKTGNPAGQYWCSARS